MVAYVDSDNGTANLTILLGEAGAKGMGYGSEAWIEVCRYLLGEAGLRKVSAGTMEVNQGMRGIMRNANMVDDGRRVRELLWHGKEVDVIHAALFAERGKGND